MKKIISIVIAILMLVSLVACDSDGGENSDGAETTAPATQTPASKFDKWVASMEGKTVNNVTLTIAVTSEDFEIDGPYTMAFKLTENLITIDGQPTDDAATVAGMQSFFGNTVLAVAACDGFVADGEGFKCDTDIVYTASVQGIDATITLSGTVITFDENGDLASVSAKMTQDFVQNSRPQQMVMDTVFTFSDFGTTEIAR